MCNFIYFFLASNFGSPEYFTCYFSFKYLPAIIVGRGQPVTHLVQAMRYQPQSRKFDY